MRLSETEFVAVWIFGRTSDVGVSFKANRAIFVFEYAHAGVRRERVWVSASKDHWEEEEAWEASGDRQNNTVVSNSWLKIKNVNLFKHGREASLIRVYRYRIVFYK